MFRIIFLFVVFSIISNMFKDSGKKDSTQKKKTITFDGKEIDISKELEKFKRMTSSNSVKNLEEKYSEKPLPKKTGSQEGYSMEGRSLEGHSMEGRPRVERRRLEMNLNKLDNTIYKKDVTLSRNSFNYDKEDFKEDVLKGVIFAEILDKPKCLRK